MQTRLRCFALVVAAGSAACRSGPGETAGPADAAATASCGPADGPAVQIVLASAFVPVQRPVPPYTSVLIGRTPGELAGRAWRVGDDAYTGAVRQPAEGAAESAARGAVLVRRVWSDTTIEGSVDLTFPSGVRVRQDFRARWQPGPRPLCG